METCGFADAALPRGEGHCVQIGQMPRARITSRGSGGKAGNRELLGGWGKEHRRFLNIGRSGYREN